MKVLGEHIVEEKDPAAAAADSWLGLSPEEREATAVSASGRDARETINKRIQAGLIAEGSVKGEAIQLTVYDREIGRASSREKVCQYMYISVVAVTLKNKQYNNNRNDPSNH